MKEKTLTSIQISVKHRDMLKKFCEKYAFNMSSFIEKLIEERTSRPDERPSIFNGDGREVKGNTAFGYYDKEHEFLSDCYDFMLWAARRLGYPIIDIEMLDVQFYQCFEDAVNTYNSLKGRPINYALIDERGKDWIKQFFFAMCKEVLGTIRRKYESIPIPGGDVTLDGPQLVFEGRSEQENLRRNIP